VKRHGSCDCEVLSDYCKALSVMRIVIYDLALIHVFIGMQLQSLDAVLSRMSIAIPGCSFHGIKTVN